MAAVASQPPSTFTSGYTQDAPFQPLSDCGTGNPFFYHVFHDDFDWSTKGLSNFYTVTATGTGESVVGQAGPGGQVLYTAGTANPSIASLQLAFAGFNVNVAPKKVFYVCRIALSSITNAAVSVIAGLIQTTATPQTITDGVYFKYLNGTLTINSTVSSTTTSATIPTAAYSTAIVASNTTFFDLAFNIDRNGNILAFVDTQLVGFVPQSNLTTSGNPQNAGPVARLVPASLTTVNLNPTLALVQLGTTNMTMAADFFGAMQER